MWHVSHCALVGMWFVGRPSAVLPLWQLEQRPTAVASCRKVAVAQLVVDLWQVSHCAVVATCVVGLTCALIDRYDPLWQLAQLPAATGLVVAAWFIVAGANAAYPLWQLSQAAPVGRWPVVLPLAWVPLWQVAHVPGTTPVCAKFVGFHAVVVWQVSHDCAVGMCVAGLASALANTYVPPWQVAQLPAATGPVVSRWLIVAGANAVNTLWHVSHCAVVGMWFVGLPRAWVPL